MNNSHGFTFCFPFFRPKVMLSGVVIVYYMTLLI
jgi:hypothetical protein